MAHERNGIGLRHLGFLGLVGGIGAVLAPACAESDAVTSTGSQSVGTNTGTTTGGGRGGEGGGFVTTGTGTTATGMGGEAGAGQGGTGGTGGTGGAGPGGAGPGGAGPGGGGGQGGGAVTSTSTGGCVPSPETCNGLDDDCNMQVDEGDPGGGAACMAVALGECKNGTEHCQQGTIKCVAAPVAPETCDGLDNNCEGNIDEGNPGGGQQCMTGLFGLCATGLTMCNGVNGVVCTPAVAPNQLMEACNGLDDDCDGMTDENIGQVGQPCTAGGFVGICQFGTYSCPAQPPFQLTCNHPAPGTVPETCNGLDDDCDGNVDDAAEVNNQPCMTGVPGVCAVGHTLCAAGSLSCVSNTPSSAETCNNLDDNCNGNVDDLANPTLTCAAQNPGAGNVASWLCTSGTCQISQCAAGSADINNNDGDGCECLTDSYGNTCAGASASSVPEGSTVNKTGGIETANGSDYLSFQFSNPGVPGSVWHPKVELTNDGGGQFAMSVYTSCGNIAQCQNNETGTSVTVWEQNYNLYSPGAGCCSDQTTKQASVIVRVFRKFGNAPTCQLYTVTATNP